MLDLSDLSDDGRAAKINHCGKFTGAKNHPRGMPTPTQAHGVCGVHKFGITATVCESVGAARLSDLSDLSDDGCAAKINHCGKLPEQSPPPGYASPTQSHE